MADNQGFIKGALIICLLPYSCGGDANPSASLMDVWLDHREAGVTIDARPSAGPKEADLEYSFPPESSSAEVFLSRPVKLARDETGLVHVLDSGAIVFTGSPHRENISDKSATRVLALENFHVPMISLCRGPEYS